MKKTIYLFLLCAFSLVSHAQLVTEKNLKDWGYGEKKLQKAPKRIFINQFFVNYQLMSSSSTTSVTGSTSAEMAVGMSGMELEDFQLITDNSYKKVVDKLTKAGFEIVTADEAQKTEMLSDWQRLPGGTPSKAQLMGYVSTAPNNFDFFMKRVDKKGKGKGTFFDSTPKLSKELGDIPVFEAAVNFQFVSLEGSSSYLVESSKMKGTVDYKLTATAVAQSSEGIFGGKIETAPSIVRIVWKGGAPGAGALAMVQVSPKGDISIPGVVEKKKFKEYVSAPTNYSNYYNGFLTIDSKEVNVTHMVKADREAYISKTQEALDQYLDYVVTKFIDNANK